MLVFTPTLAPVEPDNDKAFYFGSWDDTSSFGRHSTHLYRLPHSGIHLRSCAWLCVRKQTQETRNGLRDPSVVWSEPRVNDLPDCSSHLHSRDDIARASGGRPGGRSSLVGARGAAFPDSPSYSCWETPLIASISYMEFVFAILRREWQRHFNVNLISTHVVFILVSTILAELVGICSFQVCRAAGDN